MPKFHVEYAQREVRSFTLEAPSEKAARELLISLRDQDRLPAGEFNSADEQELLALCDEVGNVIDYFDEADEVLRTLATRWVEPGKGDCAGYLYDRAVKAKATKEVVELLRRPSLTDEQRRRRTRLELIDAMMELAPYDVERIAAAIWEWDQ